MKLLSQRNLNVYSNNASFSFNGFFRGMETFLWCDEFIWSPDMFSPHALEILYFSERW